ncbi:MAG: hypothetical protein NT138_02630 [Planctomycetales bacterium]|nr:hypothetical protein [Planctomycetales bacterium]
MTTIPAGFIPDEWNQTFAAFKRLVEHLDAMQAMLTECGELTSENCDVAYIRDQVTSEVDTLQFMASDAEQHWKARGVAVASAAGRFSLNRPADDLAWCSAALNSSWHLYNGLRRELSGQNAELCVQRLPLHLGRIPNDIGQWRERITAEIRAGALCSDEKPKESTIPDDCLQTIAGDTVLRNELTEEDRPSGEWALICGFTDDTFRNRMTKKAKGPTWRIVESSSQRYRVHVEDLPQKFRGSKKQRDEFLKVSKD